MRWTSGGESQARRRVGRPRAYDRDAALLAARDVFWEQGYERTSIADLEERTGLNRSSLYQEFGSKQKLFEACLECYADRGISGLLAGFPRRAGTGPPPRGGGAGARARGRRGRRGGGVGGGEERKGGGAGGAPPAPARVRGARAMFAGPPAWGTPGPPAIIEPFGSE